MKKRLLFMVAALLATAGMAPEASAAGRKYSGGHPYHNGFYFVPPSSAYEAVRIRPPYYYGAPAYYYPESYLAPAYPYFPAPTYPGIPFGRAGGYYLNAYGYYYTSPW